jgi:hypothetical protein
MTYCDTPETRRKPGIACLCADYDLNITYLSQPMPAFAHRSPSPSVVPVLAALVSASVQTRRASLVPAAARCAPSSRSAGRRPSLGFRHSCNSSPAASQAPRSTDESVLNRVVPECPDTRPESCSRYGTARGLSDNCGAILCDAALCGPPSDPFGCPKRTHKRPRSGKR